MDGILKNHVPLPEAREALIKKLVLSFRNKATLKYALDNTTFIILTKDERKLQNLKRYSNSPFPLISNLGLFSNSIGEWNKSLSDFGLKTRERYHDHSSNHESCGTKIFLASYDTLNSKSNRYLKHQYKRLERLRSLSSHQAYWKLCWHLMLRSWSYRIACLGSWKPRWYKEFSLKDLESIFRSLGSILDLTETSLLINNVWIESPKSKWRQLCVPSLVWRYYFHMLNQFISYIYEPSLSPSEYDGFIFNRGCKSFWENLIWNGLLEKYNSLVEVDIKSAFPNLNLLSLKEALLTDGLIPTPIVNLLLNYLSSPLIESKTYPTFESFVENSQNLEWREGYRGVPMGVGVCPVLYVITLKWALEKCQIKNKNLVYKWYADDGSFYFNLKGLYELCLQQGQGLIYILTQLLRFRNPLLTLLNEIKFLEEVGIRFCPQKSKLVRIFNIWIHPYQSLGLQVKSRISVLRQFFYVLIGKDIPLDLFGNTKGRGENPLKRKFGTNGSRKLLNYKSISNTNLNLNLITLRTSYKQYFGFLMSRLYSSESLPSSMIWPKPKFLLSLNNFLKYRSKAPYPQTLNKYNVGSKLSELFLMVNCNNKLTPEWEELNPNLLRLLKFDLPPITKIDFSKISDPLLKYETEKLDKYYYKKYSELKLNDSEREELYQEYLTHQITNSIHKL